MSIVYRKFHTSICSLFLFVSIIFLLASCNGGSDPIRSMEVDYEYLRQVMDETQRTTTDNPKFCKRWSKVLPNLVANKFKDCTEEQLALDFEIISKCSGLDEYDIEALSHKPILGSVLLEMAKSGDFDIPNYENMCAFIKNFVQGKEYQQLRLVTILNSRVQNKQITLEDWEQDRQLFIVMGLTREELDQYYQFISKPEYQYLTYQKAFLMCGIDFGNKEQERPEKIKLEALFENK